MNIWERRKKYCYDFVDAMLKYAESITLDKESEEYANALSAFVTNKESEFKEDWETENGSLKGDD